MKQSVQAAAPQRGATSQRAGVLQRKCACGQRTGGEECEECKKKRQVLRRRSGDGSAPDKAPEIVHEVLNSAGQPLDIATRGFMESRFGRDLSSVPSRRPTLQRASGHLEIGSSLDPQEREAERIAGRITAPGPTPGPPGQRFDFGDVRIHTDSRAARSAAAVNALAYTVGPNIVFGTGQYSPGTASGRELLAHELVHVAQQSAYPGASSPVLRRAPAAPCDEKQLQVLQDAAQLAATTVAQAAEKVGSFQGGAGQSAQDRKVALALSRNFSAAGEKAAPIAKTVAGKLATIRDKCGGYRYLDIFCRPATDSFCSVGAAYVDDEGKSLTLCPEFFTLKEERLRTYVFIHEMAHLADEKILDRGYTHQRVYVHLSTEEALLNADSYSRLVMELDDADQLPENRLFNAFEFPSDRYKDCDGRRKETIHAALGRAEAWILNALKVVMNRELLRNPPPELEWALGRYGLLRGQDIYRRNAAAYRKVYLDSKNKFEQSLTSQCEKDDEDCGKLGVKYDGTFHFCPSWFQKKEKEQATAALTAYYSHLDDLGGPLVAGAAAEIADATLKIGDTRAAAKSTVPQAAQEKEAPLLAKEMGADQKAEAEKIVQEIKQKYGIDVSSGPGVEAVRKKYSGAPEEVKKRVKAVSWNLRELRALAAALSHFAPILGERRASSGRAKADQELTTVSRVNNTVTLNTPHGELDSKTYGQNFEADKNVSLFDPVYTRTSRESAELTPIEAAFTHELTHALMSYLLPTYIAEIGYWTEPRKPGAEAPISDYGNQSPGEDLAEAVMYYFVEPNTLKNGDGGKPGEPGNPCPRRFKFIDREVKRWGERRR
ncbi:MAG TPA: DUF4157 domain-containing protein [Thermoanaerobaculia bacterium]